MSAQAKPTASSVEVRGILAREGAWTVTIGIALISLGWFPPSPVRGAQLSDAIGACGVALVLLGATRRVLRDATMVALAAYAACVLGAALANGGSWLRLLGAWWLASLAVGVAVLVERHELHAARIRRALVIAAVIGAVTGLVGAVLYAFGSSTSLLNHPGDLVPGNYPRIRGTMLRANGLAGLLATGLLLIGDVPRRLRLVTGAVLASALVFTFSRSWIALAGALGVYVLALGEASSRRRDIAAVVWVLACAAVMLAVSWLDVRLDPTRPWAITIADGPGTRWIHLRDALDTIAAHPLAGVGPGGAAARGWDAHFTLANVAALTGIPAAMAFAAIFGIALHRAIRSARAGHRAARALAAVLVLYALDALARDIEDQRALWVVLGMALVMPPRAAGDEPAAT